MDTPEPLRQRLCIGADHPALPGHFPGEPIVPGVVLLDHVASALAQLDGRALARIQAVKFLAPLRPDEQAWLEVSVEGTRVRFSVCGDAGMIMRGEGELA